MIVKPETVVGWHRQGFRLFSVRGYYRVLRVSRTLAGEDTVSRLQIAVALSYRRLAPGRMG